MDTTPASSTASVTTTPMQTVSASPSPAAPATSALYTNAIFKPYDVLALPLTAAATASLQHHKKCIHHRLSHCGRIEGHHQQHSRIVRGSIVNGSSSSGGGGSTNGTMTPGQLQQQQQQQSAAAAAAAASANNGNGPVAIQNQAGLVQQLNASLLAERYLLMDMVEGSTLYKCIDVRTYEELVCKVSGVLYFYFFKYIFVENKDV